MPWLRSQDMPPVKEYQRAETGKAGETLFI